MKKRAAVLVCFAVFATAALSGGQEVVEEIVAIVNEDIITLSEVRQEFVMLMAQLRAMQFPPEEQEKQQQILKEQLLENMITDLLLLQKAREMNISVAEQLRSTLEKIKQDNNMTSDADLRRAVEQQGLSYEAWLKEYEETMLKQAVVFSEVERSIALDDAEIVQYYRANPKEFTVPAEFKLSAIYLSTEERGDEEMKAVEAQIDEKLKAGADFADVAAELSDPPMNEARGDLGRFKEGELESTLEEAVAKLEPGQTSEWIFSRNGWWLLRLEEKTPGHLMTFEEAKRKVEEMLYNRKSAERIGEYLKELREKNYVRILRPDPLDR